MAQTIKDIVLFAKETVRGTVDAGTPPLPFVLQQTITGDGLVPNRTQHLGEVDDSSTFPSKTLQVPLGTTTSLVLTPSINVNTIRDLIEMITKRTNKNLMSFTIKHSQAGVADVQYLGCVTSQMSLEYSRSESPDGSSLLSGSLNFECMKAESASGATELTQGAGRHFNIAKSSFTLDSVGALEVLSYKRSMTVTLALGLIGNDGQTRVSIDDGIIEEEVTLTARFSDMAWSTLVQTGKEHVATIVHETGGGTAETLTETMGKVQASVAGRSVGNGNIIEEITLKPFHTGAADATVWTFGAGIGPAILAI